VDLELDAVIEVKVRRLARRLNLARDLAREPFALLLGRDGGIELEGDELMGREIGVAALGVAPEVDVGQRDRLAFDGDRLAALELEKALERELGDARADDLHLGA